MTINKIKIVKVKGIGSKEFPINILPNKPSLLVAPNGFGKSSFAIAFSSLNRDRLKLEDGHEHIGGNALAKPELSVEFTDKHGNTHALVADKENNQISDIFSCFVINNKVKAKGVGRKFGGKTSVSASLHIDPVVLVDNIPRNVSFSYSYTESKQVFGNNGKVLPNISPLLLNLRLVKKLSDNYSLLDQVVKSKCRREIDAIISDINLQAGNALEIKEWIRENKLEDMRNMADVQLVSDIVSNSSSKFENEIDNFLVAIQIANIYKNDKAEFKAACKFSNYSLEKTEYTELTKAFNSTWCEIKPTEKKGKLVLNFPKADQISNGQRDIITFIACLCRAKRKLKKDNSILIIDEVFDYLDDANLIAAQYYISKFIDEFKGEDKRLYPLILTHLDPEYFKNFAFSKQKTYYLDKRNANVNEHMVKLLRKRGEQSIKDDVSKFLFHYHPGSINKKIEFAALGLKETWGQGSAFHDFIFQQLGKYKKLEEGFDPLAVCCAVRVLIEKLVYNELNNANDKNDFITMFTTRKKLELAESRGVDVPEYYYLLGVLYNDVMHWKNGKDHITPVIIKLENNTIRKLVCDIPEV